MVVVREGVGDELGGVLPKCLVGRSGAWSTHLHPVWLESDAKHCDLCVRSTLGLGRSGGRVVDVLVQLHACTMAYTKDARKLNVN